MDHVAMTPGITNDLIRRRFLRRVHRTLAATCLCASLLAVVGCGAGDSTSGSTGDGGMGDGGMGDGGTPLAHPTSAQWASGCADFVGAYCHSMASCYSYFFDQLFGQGATGQASCQAFYQPQCSLLYGAPGVTDPVMQAFLGFTAAWKSGGQQYVCWPALDISDPFAWAVRSTPGTQAAGSSCIDTMQCGANLRCVYAGNCGTCVATKAAGEACTEDAECAAPTDPNEEGLRCFQGLCTPSAGLGRDCSDRPCESLLRCTYDNIAGGLRCSRGAFVGEPCDAIFCDPYHNILTCNSGVCVDSGSYPTADGSPCNYSSTHPGGVCGANYQCDERTPSVNGYIGVTTVQGGTTSYAGVQGTVLDGGACDTPVVGAAGMVVLCQRGISFETMLANAPGALAVIILNNDNPLPPSIDVGSTPPTIPVMLISKADGMSLLALVGTQVTVYGRETGVCRAPVGVNQACGAHVANCELDGLLLGCEQGTCTPWSPVCP